MTGAAIPDFVPMPCTVALPGSDTDRRLVQIGCGVLVDWNSESRRLELLTHAVVPIDAVIVMGAGLLSGNWLALMRA